MKLVDYKLNDFLDEVASNSPAPGGGSVSALSGANATALVLMVASLTTTKKKFKTLEQHIQNKYLDTVKLFEDAKTSFTKYIDEDTQSFNMVMAALKLPKDTEDAKTVRNAELEKATIASIKTPMKVAILALDMLRKMDMIIKYSNRNTTSDQGVAVLLLESACKGAILNVKINLPGLSDKTLVKEYKDVIIEMINEVNDLKEKLLEEVDYLLD